MSNEPVPRNFVRHESLGVGKVVSGDGVTLRIYFKDVREPDPAIRVRSFKAPWTHLSLIDTFPDAEFDNLPPWNGERFEGARNPVNLEQAKKTFLRFFPEGLDDPGFIKQEKQYKVSASVRYHTLVEDKLRAWAEADDHGAIAAGLNAVYGDPKASKDGPDTRLNLLYQKVEEPAYFDALRAGGADTSRYAAAMLDFLDSGTKESFDKYLEAVRKLPTKKASIDLWTTVTWLPFIADPDRHFLIKPTIVQAFAGALPFDIQYRADLNYRTYAKTVDMARYLGDVLAKSELNPARRALDMIDVQSFMWVVERWTAKDLRG